MKNKGFSLIEALIYLCAFSLFSLTVFRFVQAVCIDTRFTQARIDQILYALLPVDVLQRDLMTAQTHLRYWDEKNMVLTQVVSDDSGAAHCVQVGWRIRDHTLYRLEGEYDFAEQKWRKHSTRPVLTNVASVAWFLKEKTIKRVGRSIADEKLLSSGHIEGVQVHYERLSGLPRKMSIFVRLRNRGDA